MKHKHADLIHAWADGAEIQYFDERNEWVDVSAMPLWDKKDKYRIKPETIELTQQTDLTDEEIATLWHEGGMRDNINGYDFARVVITKFKEKNASPSVEAVRIETLEKAAKDAERYNWLKNRLHTAVGGGVTVNDEALMYEEPNEKGIVRLYWYPNTPVGFTEVTGNTLDEVVDEAMASEPQP